MEQALTFPNQFLSRSAASNIIAAAADSPPVAGFRAVAESSLNHSFDLLGSGPTVPDYSLEAAGAFGSRYSQAPGPEKEAVQLERMRTLVRTSGAFLQSLGPANRDDPDGRQAEGLSDYRPIDWHVDFKSGYRWDPGTWWLDARVAPSPGVDIKVPWELSRSHHLVAIALAGAADGRKEEAADAVSLQIIDWIAANPVRFGVNWRSPMDVSIRAANWIWALSILGTEAFPRPFLWLAAKSLYQHGQFIEANLDFEHISPDNHYLADIVGLLHVGAALPGIPEASAWFALCFQELERQMAHTVLPDGLSYEGSTGYHRLVAEMFSLGALVSVNLPDAVRASALSPVRARRRSPRVAPDEWDFDPRSRTVFSDRFWSRLTAMIQATRDLTKPNGLVPQFGDQDNSRFVRFDWPGTVTDGRLVEEPHDHRHLSALAGPMLDISSDEQPSKYPVDAAVGHALWEGRSRPTVRQIAASDVQRFSGADTDVTWFPSGGICVMRNASAWIAIRIGTAGAVSPTGHTHDDLLSFVLNVGGHDFIVDPGSGVYTADSSLRNALRASSAHSTIRSDSSAGLVNPGELFDRREEGRIDHISVSPGEVEATYSRGRNHVTRRWQFKKGELTITDRFTGDANWTVRMILAPEVSVLEKSAGIEYELRNRDVTLSVICEAPGSGLQVIECPYSSGYGNVGTTRQLQLIVGRDHDRASVRINYAYSE
ncbi:MAG: alginate lyase family protein [Chloroflexi bacterium]|nr:alginate lyase family protein [Chloroflexota bacterium]